MKDPLTRRAVQLTMLYGCACLVLVTAMHASGGHQWPVFSWFDLLAIVLTTCVVPLTALLWLTYAIFRFARKGRGILPFSLIGVALPLVYYGAWRVPPLIARYEHSRQLELARIDVMSDAPLLSEHGHPIGIRFMYQIRLPRGLSSMGRQPPADSPSAALYIPYEKSTLMYFAIRASNLDQVGGAGFPAGTSTITIDAVPAFAPMFVQMPGAFSPADARNRCFRWKNAVDRQRQLEAAPQRVYVEIGPDDRFVARGTRFTAHDYRLADFYEGALAEGAVECSR